MIKMQKETKQETKEFVEALKNLDTEEKKQALAYALGLQAGKLLATTQKQAS